MSASFIISCFFLITYILSTNSTQHFSKYNDIPFPLSLRREAISEIKAMFNFGFDSYLKYAFPHDELKPVTGSYTDSLPELGNAKNTNKLYNGLALTLIDSLDSLLLFNRTDSFINAHKYLSTAIHTTINNTNNDSHRHIFSGFDIDLRVHVFETNIRILGGLLSAHSLSTHPKWTKLFFSNHPIFLKKYKNEFLSLAQDLGEFGCIYLYFTVMYIFICICTAVYYQHSIHRMLYLLHGLICKREYWMVRQERLVQRG